MLLKPFVLNNHDRLVFPCNFFPELDFSVFEDLEQFSAVIRRDFGEKAPSEADILSRIQGKEYPTRYELCRDLALNLFWVNRFVLTMYDKRPIRWGDLPRHRDDIFIPIYKPRDASSIVTAIEKCYRRLPAAWDKETEDRSFHVLLNVFLNKHAAGGELRPIKATIPEILKDPRNLTCHLTQYDPEYPAYSYDDIIDFCHDVPELEALMRQAMVLHNQYPWDPRTSTRTEVGKLHRQDFVVAFYPKDNHVLQFIGRVKRNGNGQHHINVPRPETLALSEPEKPCPPVVVRDQFQVFPRLEAIAVYKGEIPCTNDDLIRNHAYCWTHMTAADIAEKTGIEERCYSVLSLEDMSLLAARAAIEKSGRKPSEIGAVLFCSCTSTRTIPSVATWLSGELGLSQTHASCDIVAACAGMSYGLSEAVRLLQEIKEPLLVVCAEKFSDKIGTVRTSRMIFGDGAAAALVGPAPPGASPDIEVFQTYASGPWSEVNSIIWPNPEFDNNITVYGPEVKALAKRYLSQMTKELRALPNPDGGPGTLLDAIDLVVPHQANKTMVTELAQAAGITADRMYFDIERVGNTSAASILIAIHDAVEEGWIDRPMRIFGPGFGAGAVGGYVVMRVDPKIVVCSSQERTSFMSNNGIRNHVSGNGAVRNGHGNGATSNGNAGVRLNAHTFIGNGSAAKSIVITSNGHMNDVIGGGSLEDKVALVTGASRGIGRAIALELARRGAKVAIDYRSDVLHAQQAARDIRALGAECMIIKGDVAQKGEAKHIIEKVLNKWHHLDILVNNAGITRDKTMRKMTDEDWAEVINVNLNGTFYCTSAALPAMINQRFGRIINISSVVGQMGNFGQANYSASKGGIIAFTKTLALEMAKYNITANSIAPGFTATDMVEAIPEELAAQVKAKIPLGRFATPEEIAKAAAFLAAEGDYITGQELNVNGGYHM